MARSENQDKQSSARTAAKTAAKGAAAKPGARTPAKATAGRASARTPAGRTPAKPGSGGRAAARGPRSETRDNPVAKSSKTQDKAERSSSSTTDATGGQAVNREMKRMMAKREGAADRLKRPTAPKAKRTKPLTFLKEVRGELGRVAWPTRPEVITYSVVVVVTVAFFMVIIAGIDYVALNGVLFLIDRGGR